MHRTGMLALARVASTIAGFFAITLLVFLAFYAVPSSSSLPRRGPSQLPATQPGYLHYLWAFVRRGDLGRSFRYREAVTTHIMRGVPTTLSLLAGGLVIALLLSVVAVLRPRSRLDRGIALFAVAGICVHPVWLSLVLSWLFGAHWGVLPEQGYCGITSVSTGCSGVTHWASHLLLPWLVLGVASGAFYTLGVQAVLRPQLDEEYVVEARAKGVGERRIMRAHVLRNVAPQLLALFVTNLGVAFSAVVFIESVFDLPGLGQMFRLSLRQHDLPVTAGIVLLVTLTILVLSLVVELATLGLRPMRRAAPSARRGQRSARTSSSSVPASAPPAPPARAQ